MTIPWWLLLIIAAIVLYLIWQFIKSFGGLMGNLENPQKGWVVV